MRTHRFAPFYALPLFAVVAFGSPALAANAETAAAADVLFKDAKKLAAAGDFAQACPKFIESQRLDPSAGTLLNIGNCFEKLDKLASAYGAFREAEVLARNKGDEGRQGEAASRADALAAKIAHLAIVVPPKARVPDFELKKDGNLMGEGQWGASLPADVGHHEIAASAPGYKPWSTVVRIDTNGSSASVEVPPLEKLSAEATGKPGLTWNAQRIAGLTVGGAGVVGLVLGGVFGGLTLAKASASKSHCAPDLSTCDSTGGQLQHDAHTTANISNATFAIGGAALIAGVITFATAPSGSAKLAPRSARISVGPLAGAGMTGLILRGGW